jgi:ferredoxin-type protein NapF
MYLSENPKSIRSVSRSALLRGKLREPTPSLRPPGALRPAEFVNTCTRCHECIRACPTQVIVSGSSRFPVLDFSRGECTSCGDCITACPDGALYAEHVTGARAVTVSVSETCLSSRGITCRICGDRCDPRAIRFKLKTGGKSIPQIDSTACNGCGACVAPCPVAAITVAPIEEGDIP